MSVARDEIFDQVQMIVADMLELPLDQIGSHTSVESVANWDSLKHLNLVVGLEDELSVKFMPEEVAELTSVEAILNSLEKKFDS